MKRTLKAAALTEVNSRIHDYALESESPEASWEFFCECGDPGCAEQVAVTLDELAALRKDGRPVLADGHAIPAGKPSAVEPARGRKPR